VAALKVGDVDGKRMTMRIEHGKGAKDRYAMLSPLLLQRLRYLWRVARPGQDDRRVTMRTLRHSFATH
jgi:integrase/recombinase XerD